MLDANGVSGADVIIPLKTRAVYKDNDKKNLDSLITLS